MVVGIVPLVTATTKSLVRMVCLPVGKRPLFFCESLGMRRVACTVCLLFWWSVKLFGFWLAPSNRLLWVITGFFDQEVLESQLRLLVQPGRALQIGMGILRMSNARESPNEWLCCRDSLRGRLL